MVGGFDREDVPRVGGDDVGGDEVDVLGRVGHSIGVEVTFIRIAAVEEGAFDPFGRYRSLRAGSGPGGSVRDSDASQTPSGNPIAVTTPRAIFSIIDSESRRSLRVGSRRLVFRTTVMFSA